MHSLTAGQACNDGADWTSLTGAPFMRQLLVAPESKMTQLLMVSMSMLIVWRTVVVARAYGWVGVGQEGNTFDFKF